MPGIFNARIFNDAIFNTAPSAVVEQPSGGFERQHSGSWGNLRPARRKTREEIRAEREAYGIIPARVEKVIEKVARTPEIAIEAKLHRELDRLRLAYRAKYAEILRLEIEARKNDDEEAILLLLH